MLTDTIYYTEIINFKKDLVNYLLKLGRNVEYIRKTKDMIDKVGDRELFYKWLTKSDKYSTLELRECFKNTEFNYWKTLEASNMIDELDTYSILNNN